MEPLKIERIPDCRTDAELMRLVLARDEAAFAVLVKRYTAHVSYITMRYLKNRDEAADITQEVFLKVFRRAHLWKLDAPFAPWLNAIARKSCIDALRKRGRWNRFLASLEPSDLLRHKIPPPDQGAYDHEIMEAILRAFERLGKDQQIAEMRYLQELPRAVIAEVLGISEDEAKRSLERAARRLRRNLSETLSPQDEDSHAPKKERASNVK